MYWQCWGPLPIQLAGVVAEWHAPEIELQYCHPFLTTENLISGEKPSFQILMINASKHLPLHPLHHTSHCGSDAIFSVVMKEQTNNFWY